MSVSNATDQPTVEQGRQGRRWLVVYLCVAVALLIGWAWWRHRLYTRAMFDIQSEIVSGQYAIASRNLEQLVSWKSDSSGQLAYLLGTCEVSRGRVAAADAAWGG